mmetsp:Transcript_11335/g.18971  ORF Transcript_11335/g.18971 Transcript_11335/m.18971 type:complete len:106 (-) Transcript_11335:541-858(-)
MSSSGATVLSLMLGEGDAALSLLDVVADSVDDDDNDDDDDDVVATLVELFISEILESDVDEEDGAVTEALVDEVTTMLDELPASLVVSGAGVAPGGAGDGNGLSL